MTYAVAAAFAVMCVCYAWFQRIKRTPGHSRTLEITVKCGATAMAVLVAGLGAMVHGTTAGWLMLAGLAVCAAADGVLCVYFVPGGALFALGHVLYMTAFCLMQPPTWESAVVFAVLMGLISIGFYRFRKEIGPQRMKLAYAYAGVLSVMAAMAAPQKPLYTIGALLFVFSDATLGYLLLGKNNDRLDYISLGAYYLGQFLLGLAVFVG